MPEKLIVALSKSSPLSRESHISVSQLTDQPLILLSREHEPALHDAIFDLFRKEGVVPKIAHQANEVTSMMSLVAANVGVALVPESFQHIAVSGLIYRPFEKDIGRFEAGIAWHRDNDSSALRTILKIMEEVSDEPQS